VTAGAPPPSRRLEGWPIVGWCALAVGTVVALILATDGTGEAGIRAVIRGTARTSAALLVVVWGGCGVLVSAW